MSAATNSVKDIWKTYLYWVFLISLVFFPTYPFCNWFTSQRMHTFGLYLPSELEIPLVPGFIWAYLSMYILFLTPPFFLNVSELQALGKRLLAGTILASLAFLVIPSHLGFTRVIPADLFYETIFTGLFAVDQPHNMVPSLHVIFSSLIVFALLDASKTDVSKAVWSGWLILIVVSTLLVHQHHLLDGLTGLTVALVIHRLILKRESIASHVS